MESQARRTARWVLAVLALAIGGALYAQALDDNNRVEVVLNDGTHVLMLGAAPAIGNPAKSLLYYYLPTNLHLSRGPDGTPQFLFLKYTTDNAGTPAGIQGGLIHFLMEWGLTATQSAEAQQLLVQKVPKAQLMGAAQVVPESETGSFRIISATLTAPGRTRSLVASGKAPVLPGGKIAVAADLDAYGAQLLEATFGKNHSITDISIELSLAYTAIVPAAKGTVTMDWNKLNSSYDSLGAVWKQRQSGTLKSETCFVFCWGSSNPVYASSYDESRTQVQMLIDSKVIDFQWQETVSDDRVTPIREAFIKYFLASFAPQADQDKLPEEKAADTTKVPDIKSGSDYRYRKVSRSTAITRKHEAFNLNFQLAFKRPSPVTENLATWYNSVADNPKCIQSINLNDPFYQNMSVMFRVDFDAPKELFSSLINYVTVAMQHDRSTGAPFMKDTTIDEEYIKKYGVMTTFTYARDASGTRDPWTYKYKTQWSLRGGKLYPQTPTWTTVTSLAAVTLVPPVTPHRITLEGSLPDLTASGVVRVTAQIKYQQFGIEQSQNIQLGVADGKPSVDTTIFIDRNVKGYVYRLVLNHKTLGKLATAWTPMVNDDYIYVNIPAEILVAGALASAAKDSAGVTPANVIDKFAAVLGGGTPP